MTRHPELPERDRRILGVLVQAYIEHGRADLVAVAGQPRLRRLVGDAAQRHGPARGAGLRPPAAHLGRARPDRPGLPHLRRSAARRAARPRGPRRSVEERLRRAGTVEDVLSHVVAGDVARASHQVGFAIAPAAEMRRSSASISSPLDGGKRARRGRRRRRPRLAQGRRAGRGRVGRGELQQAANYLNTEFKGRSLADVRQAVLERLREERTLYDQLMARALRLASTTFEGIEPRPSSSSRARRCCSTTSAARTRS